MQTQIKETSKGFIGTIAWSDGVKINSRAFPTSVEAQDWLLDQVAAQKGHVYRDSPIKKVAAALAAIAILLPMALPAVAQYTPPNTGGPNKTTSSSTR